MPSMIRTTPCWLLLLVIGASSVAQPDPDLALETLMARYWDAEVEARPLTWASSGETRFRDRLDDLSEAGLIARRQGLDGAIAELQNIDSTQLTAANRTSYQVFQWMLRNERKTLDYDWKYVTFNTYSGWHSELAGVVAATSYSTAQDYQDLLKRLSAVGTYARQQIELLQKGVEVGYVQPCEVLEGYESTISGYVSDTPENSVFYKPFTHIPDSVGAARRARLQREARRVIGDIVNPAYKNYHDYYVKDYKPACRDQVGLSSLPRGRELYDHFVRFYTTTETDADTVHALGLSEVARIRGEMQGILEQVNFSGDLAAFRTFLRSDPRFYVTDENAYLRRVAVITKSIDGRLPEYFAQLPRNPYGIEQIPAQSAPKTATAYYQPGAADGTRAGKYFVNTYDLASRPLYELPALSLHESVPGHHLQISIQQELTTLPQFRRIYYFHAFGEGWGLYAERVGEEMGIYKTPYERFGRLIYEMWRASRLVVDTGMHARGWSRQQAIDYMMANTGLTLHNITAEVDRYISWPGQALAYKHGELKILELRRRAELALGERFSLRDFHSAVLGSGSLPLTVLETQIDLWIARNSAPD